MGDSIKPVEDIARQAALGAAKVAVDAATERLADAVRAGRRKDDAEHLAALGAVKAWQADFLPEDTSKLYDGTDALPKAELAAAMVQQPGTARVTLADLINMIDQVEYSHPTHTPHFTICALRLNTGFCVLGSSAPMDAANFNADFGRKLAYDDAVRSLSAHVAFSRLAGTFKPVSPVSGPVAASTPTLEPVAASEPTPEPMNAPSRDDLRYIRRDAMDFALRTFGAYRLQNEELSELIARADAIADFIANGTE